MSEELGTLGQRLDCQARRMTARSEVALPWAAPFEVLLDHLAELPSPAGERFARREAAGAESAWPVTGNGMSGPAVAPLGRPLPHDTVARLRTLVGPGVETMRVHDDDAADATASAHGADAVTIGSDVFFRHGRLNPRHPRGFGLLVHEATHVVERMRPGRSSRRATAGGVTQEETLALARETAVLSGTTPVPAAGEHWSRPAMSPRGVQHAPAASAPPLSLGAVLPPPAATPPTVAPPAIAQVAAPAARPMTAAADRPAVAPPPAATGVDVDALRSRIVRDLMRQLRDEFERGG